MRGNFGEVPVEQLGAIVCERVERGEDTWSSICRRLGWIRRDTGTADTTRLKRSLGLAAQPPAGGGATTRAMRYPTAVAIAQAVDADLVEVGL